MFWYQREKLYQEEIKRLREQLNEQYNTIEQLLIREQQLLQENFDNNTQILDLMKVVVENKLNSTETSISENKLQ